jgi:hypothetical protein
MRVLAHTRSTNVLVVVAHVMHTESSSDMHTHQYVDSCATVSRLECSCYIRQSIAMVHCSGEHMDVELQLPVSDHEESAVHFESDFAKLWWHGLPQWARLHCLIV